jgi:hypothetical protein
MNFLHRFMAYDEKDVLNENHSWSELTSIQPNKLKPFEFTLHWGETKEVFQCHNRNNLLAILFRMMEDDKRTETKNLKALQIYRSTEVDFNI